MGMTTKPDLPLRLALATRPCPECAGDPLTGHQSIPGAKACHGTGRVPWLNGVRVTCDGCYGHADRRQDFCDCNRRGWVVSEDTEAWLEAAKPEMLKRNWCLVPRQSGWAIVYWDGYTGEGSEWEAVVVAPTVKEALQLALEKVVPV